VNKITDEQIKQKLAEGRNYKLYFELKNKYDEVVAENNQLAAIYSTIRDYQSEPFNEATREVQANKLLEQTKTFCIPHKLDPKKLASLKLGILDYQDCLFICLKVNAIPADNNRAERDIKQLVIKRR